MPSSNTNVSDQSAYIPPSSDDAGDVLSWDADSLFFSSLATFSGIYLPICTPPRLEEDLTDHLSTVDDPPLFDASHLFTPPRSSPNLRPATESAQPQLGGSEDDERSHSVPSPTRRDVVPFEVRDAPPHQLRRHQCQSCTYSCTKLQDLRKHQFKHARPDAANCFRCTNPPCDKRFPRKDNRDRHSRHYCQFGNRLARGGVQPDVLGARDMEGLLDAREIP